MNKQARTQVHRAKEKGDDNKGSAIPLPNTNTIGSYTNGNFSTQIHVWTYKCSLDRGESGHST